MNDVPEKDRLHKRSSALLCALWFATLSPSALLPQNSDPKRLQSEAVPESSTQDRTPRKAFTAIILYHVWDNDRQAFRDATALDGEGLSIRAVRADGAVVKGSIRNTPDGGIAFHRTITDPVARRVTYVEVDYGARAVRSRPLGRKLANANLAHSSVCTSDPTAEWSTLLGFSVVHWHEVRPRPADYWVAPALDCFLLKRAYDVEDGTGRFIAIHEAVFVVEGEPNPALFRIPAETEADPAIPVVKELLEAHRKSPQAAPKKDQ